MVAPLLLRLRTFWFGGPVDLYPSSVSVQKINATITPVVPAIP